MRLLLILTYFTSYLLVSCAVSKCYESSNIDFYSSNLTIEECTPPFMDFCATATIKNGDVSDFTCGVEEFCMSKRCSNSMHCTEPGTFERDYPGLSEVKFTVTCCDTDLCNVESSAKTLYRTSFIFVFYISKFYYLYFVTVWYLFC